ncbi:GNAT family N-acetyltransferase [Kribbella sp. NPDC058693]|uniref:GNAT family N-acetyltransferase n=1 Tax=Kribbella sp. NPDC058693 TaxID=3346602 RepID=UPI003669E3F0
MRAQLTSDASAYRDLAFPFLQGDPVRHLIILTSVQEHADSPRSEPAYFVSVHDGPEDAVVGAAMRAPGRLVYLGALRPEYAEIVADALLEVLPDVPGVAGDRVVAARFADRWCARLGCRATEVRGARLHKLDRLTPLPADGLPRLMTADDVELVAAWGADGFAQEIGGNYLDWSRLHLRERRLWLWTADEEPVSMVAHHLPVFGVCRVGPVYTPPEHRRHGYAGALTSHVSAEILSAGNQACLYTNLADPTSNSIYHHAGYRPVADFVEMEFSA